MEVSKWSQTNSETGRREGTVHHCQARRGFCSHKIDGLDLSTICWPCRAARSGPSVNGSATVPLSSFQTPTTSRGVLRPAADMLFETFRTEILLDRSVQVPVRLFGLGQRHSGSRHAAKPCPLLIELHDSQVGLSVLNVEQQPGRSSTPQGNPPRAMSSAP